MRQRSAWVTSVICGCACRALLWAMATPAMADVSSAKLDFQCVTSFVAVVSNNDTLEISQVDVVKLSDGTEYLLAVGITPNKANREAGAKAILDTRTIASAKAYKQAASFLVGEVQSKESLTEIKRTEKVSTDKGIESRVDKLTRIREEYIVEDAQAVLPQSKIVATWFNEDRSLFYSVLAVPLKRK